MHTLKFQYTALETRKYDKLKTTETDKVKGNYLSHDKHVTVIVVPPLHKCNISIFLQNHIPKKVLAKVLTNDHWSFSGKSLFDSDRTTLLFQCLILNHQVLTLFSLEQTEGDILPLATLLNSQRCRIQEITVLYLKISRHQLEI